MMMVTREQVRMRVRRRLANNDLRCHREMDEEVEELQWPSDMADFVAYFTCITVCILKER